MDNGGAILGDAASPETMGGEGHRKNQKRLYHPVCARSGVSPGVLRLERLAVGCPNLDLSRCFAQPLVSPVLFRRAQARNPNAEKKIEKG